MVDITSLPSWMVVNPAGSPPWLGSDVGSEAGVVCAGSEGPALGVPACWPQAHSASVMARASSRAANFFIFFIFIHLHSICGGRNTARHAMRRVRRSLSQCVDYK